MQQLSLIFEPGLSARHRSLRECTAAAVYRFGLTEVSLLLDSSLSHLSEKLAGVDSAGRNRGMSLDEFEQFLAKTGDMTPLHYLIDKFIRSDEAKRQSAQLKLAQRIEEITGLMVDAGLMASGPKPKRRARR